MPLLYRLRRSVALFVCPELSAEARLKAARKAGFFDVATVLNAQKNCAEAVCVTGQPDPIITDYSEFMGALSQNYYRSEQPPFAMCYRDTVWLAQRFGWDIPGRSIARRMLAVGRS